MICVLHQHTTIPIKLCFCQEQKKAPVYLLDSRLYEETEFGQIHSKLQGSLTKPYIWLTGA